MGKEPKMIWSDDKRLFLVYDSSDTIGMGRFGKKFLESVALRSEG